MCSPIAAIGGVQAVGGIMSAFSSAGQASQQQAMLNYQANIADINARLTDMAADQEIKKGQAAEQDLVMQANQLKSSQRVAFAANGLDMTEGTPVQILKSTDFMANRDIDVVRANAARSAFGVSTQAMNYRNQAAASRAGADQINPFMIGATSLISSAGNVASSWYQMSKYDSLMPKKGFS